MWNCLVRQSLHRIANLACLQCTTLTTTLLDLVPTDKSNAFVRRGSLELSDALPKRTWFPLEKAAQQDCVVNNHSPVVYMLSGGRNEHDLSSDCSIYTETHNPAVRDHDHSQENILDELGAISDRLGIRSPTISPNPCARCELPVSCMTVFFECGRRTVIVRTLQVSCISFQVSM